MTPILRSNEVSMNEQHAGRDQIPYDLLLPAYELLNTPQYIRLHHSPCPICIHFQRDLAGYASDEHGDMSYYATCDNCGNWERL